MATKTSKTKKTAAAAKAAPKATARANTKAPARKAKAAVAPLAANTAASLHSIDIKTALVGGGLGALVGTLATKLIFFR